MLNLTPKTVYEVDYQDLERYIEECYGFTAGRVELPVIEEWGNYADHTFFVEKGEIEKSWEMEKLEKFKRNPSSTNFILRTILKDLCNQDKLPQGDYLVKVFW